MFGLFVHAWYMLGFVIHVWYSLASNGRLQAHTKTFDTNLTRWIDPRRPEAPGIPEIIPASTPNIKIWYIHHWEAMGINRRITFSNRRVSKRNLGVETKRISMDFRS